MIDFFALANHIEALRLCALRSLGSLQDELAERAVPSSLAGHAVNPSRGLDDGLDATKELTGTYLQRVLRWWAGKGPAVSA
ncbi:hypothetical protein XarbCFBP7408_18970 [Xanthomonas arboricola pv. guizotiae]|uniref:Uncharacterized protein n=1 Tax=Xanthomonas arboricola pv. guizotiae TaxID=487867 RepID=A0A2S6ZTA9_9XANT|nr:hypothetical protein XarbCFBP7409_17190 [Xanthomonas arboricola pv. guizotiae]PPU19601.1 hypothetical protein XarbCFBP7408_18970 [Xanthomonas arboricola pv. guizotiae]